MQRLVKEGYINSLRGPAGGFSLHKPPEKISFLNIYEAIEGTINIPSCPMDKQICPFDKCIMNNLLNRMTEEFRQYMGEQRVSDYMK